MSMMPNMINNQMYQYQNQQREQQDQYIRRTHRNALDTEMPSNRYGKISKKDTSQGFMELLNSGSIDGSFTGMFLYFLQITWVSLIILHMELFFPFQKPTKFSTFDLL